MVSRCRMFILTAFIASLPLLGCGEKKNKARQNDSPAAAVNCDSEEYEYEECNNTGSTSGGTVSAPPRSTPTPGGGGTGPSNTPTPAPTDGGTGGTAGDPTPTPDDGSDGSGGTASDPTPTPTPDTGGTAGDPPDDDPPGDDTPVRAVPLQIIEIEAVDEEGVDRDRQVRVDFNSKVDEADFTAESQLVFRLTREEGPKLVSDFLPNNPDGTPGAPTGQDCFDQREYPWRVKIRGEGVAQDNRLKQGENFCIVILGDDFGLGEDNGISLLRDTMQNAIDNQFGGDRVFEVSCADLDTQVDNTNTRCDFTVAVETLILSTTNKDRLIEIMPNTFTDGDGDGNGLLVFKLGDTDPDDHIEPDVHPELPYEYTASNALDENNIFEVNDTFSIRFNVAMNIAQTRGWIHEYLNATGSPFKGKVDTEGTAIAVSDYDGTATNGTSCGRGCTFTIRVTDEVDMRNIAGNRYRLVFPAKALTSAEGAENTSKILRFEIHDRPSAPELSEVYATLNENEGLTGFPVRLENLRLDPGDNLTFRFSDLNKVLDPDQTATELLRVIEEKIVCAQGVNLDTSMIVPNGLLFTFTVPADCHIATALNNTFTVAVDSIEDTSGNKTKINPAKRTVTLTRTDPPTVPELFAAVPNRLSARTEWENSTLNEGDTVTFYFDDPYNNDEDPSIRDTEGEDVVVLMENSDDQVAEAIIREMGKLSPDCPAGILNIGMVAVIDAGLRSSAIGADGKDGLEFQFTVPAGCKIPTATIQRVAFPGLRDNSAGDNGNGTLISSTKNFGNIPVFDRPTVPVITQVTASWGGNVDTSICGDKLLHENDTLRFEFFDEDGFELRNDVNQVSEKIAEAISQYCPNFPAANVVREVGVDNDGFDHYNATLPAGCEINTSVTRVFSVPAGLFDKSGNADGDGTVTPVLRGELLAVDALSLIVDFQNSEVCLQEVGTRCEGNTVLGDGLLAPGDFFYLSFSSDLAGCPGAEPMDSVRTLAAVNTGAEAMLGDFFHTTEVYDVNKAIKQDNAGNEDVVPHFYKVIIEPSKRFNVANAVPIRVGNSTFNVTTKEGAQALNLSGSVHDSMMNEITLRYKAGTANGGAIQAIFELVGTGSILPGRWVLYSVSDDLNKINQVFEITFDDQQTGPTLNLLPQ